MRKSFKRNQENFALTFLWNFQATTAKQEISNNNRNKNSVYKQKNKNCFVLEEPEKNGTIELQNSERLLSKSLKVR